MFLVLRYFLLFVEITCGLLLIGIILMQRSKGQGAGTAFGGGMGESLFGSRAGNVLTKMTVVLTIIFLIYLRISPLSLNIGNMKKNGDC